MLFVCLKCLTKREIKTSKLNAIKSENFVVAYITNY